MSKVNRPTLCILLYVMICEPTDIVLCGEGPHLVHEQAWVSEAVSVTIMRIHRVQGRHRRLHPVVAVKGSSSCVSDACKRGCVSCGSSCGVVFKKNDGSTSASICWGNVSVILCDWIRGFSVQLCRGTFFVSGSWRRLARRFRFTVRQKYCCVVLL